MIYFGDNHTDVPDSWLVVWTDSRAEYKVEGQLAAMGLSPWLENLRNQGTRCRSRAGWRRYPGDGIGELASGDYHDRSLSRPSEWLG